MAKTAVADIIVPTQFEKYAIERTAQGLSNSQALILRGVFWMARPIIPTDSELSREWKKPAALKVTLRDTPESAGNKLYGELWQSGARKGDRIIPRGQEA